VAVEPKNSAALLGKEPGLHQIQGIGDGFIPPVLDVSLIDDVEVVADEDAIDTAADSLEWLVCWWELHQALCLGSYQGLSQARRRAQGCNDSSDRAERYFSPH